MDLLENAGWICNESNPSPLLQPSGFSLIHILHQKLFHGKLISRSEAPSEFSAALQQNKEETMGFSEERGDLR